MTAEQFDEIVEVRIKSIRAVLVSKAKEYASDDRLHNFKETAKEWGGTPAENCWGFLKKHLTSVKDFVTGLKNPTPALVNEKIGDAINYLILLEAIFYESYLPPEKRKV